MSTYHVYLSTKSPNLMERQNPLDKLLDRDCKAKEKKSGGLKDSL